MSKIILDKDIVISIIFVFVVLVIVSIGFCLPSKEEVEFESDFKQALERVEGDNSLVE